jgi:hypothetical protein
MIPEGRGGHGLRRTPVGWKGSRGGAVLFLGFRLRGLQGYGVGWREERSINTLGGSASAFQSEEESWHDR